MDGMSAPAASIRVLRIIARMNVGGPAVEVSNVMRLLPCGEFTQTLLVGHVAEGEADFLDTQGSDVPFTRIAGLGRTIRPFDDFRAFLAIRRTLVKIRPHIVHTHTAKAGALGRLAALTIQPRPKIVHTFHGHVLTGYFSRAATLGVSLIERLLAKFSNELITVGPEVREQLLAAGIGRPDHFQVIEPGVRLRQQPSRTEARLLLGIDHDALVMCMVGRLAPIKRPDRLLDVVRGLAPSFPSLRVLVAGEGELSEELRARATAEALPIRFLGWRDDVETVFAASDLAILTSDNEGTPLSLVQAGLLSVPAVATDVGSVRHVVIDGVTGWLTDTGPSDLIAAAQAALSSPELRRERGARAREHLMRTYAVDQFVEKHARLYRMLARQ